MYVRNAFQLKTRSVLLVLLEAIEIFVSNYQYKF